MGCLCDQGLSGFIGMRLAQHNRYIHCVPPTMKFLEAYRVMQGGECMTWHKARRRINPPRRIGVVSCVIFTYLCLIDTTYVILHTHLYY